ncbi:MAG: peptidoglycan-binding protein [Patescibacteria group bacterium]|nr:peptidoglycan-binding protein [Patescibacteria group bacterium]
MNTYANSRFVSVTIGAALAASLFAAAPPVMAASLTAAQIDAVTNLLQAFGADPATIANVQVALEGTTASATSTQVSSGLSSSVGESAQSANGSGCPVLSAGNLQAGSTGDDVSRLQAFLGKDRNIYPEGAVTGYFGSMTEEAVRRWQAAHNVVSTGTPETTGFGIVGPRTRSEMDNEMEVECEGGGAGSTETSASSSASMHESSSGDQAASSTPEGN